jgi:hypothetical protein
VLERGDFEEQCRPGGLRTPGDSGVNIRKLLHILKFLFQDGLLIVASKGFNYGFGSIVLAFYVQALQCGKFTGVCR